LALSQIGPERRAIPEDKQVLVDSRSDQRIVSIRSEIALSKEAASIPEKSRKTALEFSRTDTVMIRGADHMYSGEEEQVARTIATWADNQLLPIGRTEGAGGKR
jgi:hypothetical protein